MIGQAVVDGQAGKALGVRAVDDDLVVLLEAGQNLGGGVEVDRPRNVLG
jgi:hypothetical protein